MLKWIETTGKTENDAINVALKTLGLDRDSVSVEVLARAKTGFLGIGSQPARIKVSYEVPDEPVKPVKTEEKPVEAAPVAVPVQENKAVLPEKPAIKAEQALEVVVPRAKEKKPVERATESKNAAVEETPAPKAKKSRSRRKKPTKPVVEAPAKVEAPAAEQKKAPAEPVEDRTEQVEAFLSGLMERLNVEAKPQITIAEENIYQVDLVGENLGNLIGRRGETLDAIQQLTNYAVNNGKNQRIRIHIDAEHYRAKREESLQRLARKTAGKAMKYRRNMMLEPMNAYERHVIHAALQEYDACISTYSTGTEPNRRIIVAYNRVK